MIEITSFLLTKNEMMFKMKIEDDNMKLDCSWTRDDLKTYLKKKRRITNIIFLLFGIYFYFSWTKYGFLDVNTDKKILWLGFVIYFLAIIFLLWAITKLYVFLKLRRNDKKTSNAYGTYHIEANKKKISSSIGEEKFSYEWKDITTFRIRRKYFFLKTREDKIGLYFRREILKGDYDKLLSYVKEQLAS